MDYNICREITPVQSHEPFNCDPSFHDWSERFKQNSQNPVEDEDGYKIILNVRHFEPDELEIKTVDFNNQIVIEGKHEEKSDPSHGFTSRQFTRKYCLPSDVEVDLIQSRISSDGVLQIDAPRKLPHVDDYLVKQEEWKEKDIQEPSFKHDETSILLKAKRWLALPDFHFEPFWERFGSYKVPDLFGIHSDKDFFKVLVDVKHFALEELNVSCTDRYVRIHGKHSDRSDSHGSISRQFSRTFDIPKGIKAEDLRSNLTLHGVLEIIASKHPKSNDCEVVKEVPIFQTNENEVAGKQGGKIVENINFAKNQ